MKKLFSLGKIFVSDFLKDGEEPRHPPSELKLLLDDNGAVRLESRPPNDTMWGKYWYRSNINDTMVQELKSIVNSILHTTRLEDGDVWIDVASNVGTLLSFVPKNIIRIGIDPADDTFKQEAEQHANLIVQDYFSAQSFKNTKYGNLKAKVITSIAMFYDLENPEIFIRDIYDVLSDQGLWVLQLSYTPLMLEQLAFDNILHEHFYYYSLFNLKNLFEKNGFKIVDCQLNDTNGGSFRVYAMKEKADIKSFAKQPYRDVCNFRIKSLLEYEKTLKLDEVETWTNFYKRINERKKQVVSFIEQEKAKGKIIYGLGASTKFNTLLQYFGLDNSLIDAIAERSPAKFGLKTVGTNIPICSEEQMRAKQPDYCILGPWFFIDDLVKREKDYLEKGGKFIVPLPQFEIIGK